MNYQIEQIVSFSTNRQSLSNLGSECLSLGMLDRNAQIMLELESISRELFLFKSPLSRQILLVVVSRSGVCELRKLFKLMEATAIATRLHIQSLEEEGYVELSPHETNRRCKLIRLTAKGVALMREYELRCQQALAAWSEPQPNY